MELDEHQLARLDAALRCPFDAKAAGFPIGARGLIYGIWHAILATNLSDRLFADLLQSWDGRAHPSIWEEPDDDDATSRTPVNVYLEHLDAEELSGLLPLLEGSRKDMADVRRDGPAHRVRTDLPGPVGTEGAVHLPAVARPALGVWLDEEFQRPTGWMQGMRLVTAETREKHWPPSTVKTEKQLLEYSRSKPDEGILNIGIDKPWLLWCCLASIEGAFRRDADLLLESEAVLEFGGARLHDLQPAQYLKIWADLISQGGFRLGIEHKRDVGAADGAMTRNMVYDISITGSEFHCFPVQTYPNVRHEFLEGGLEVWA